MSKRKGPESLELPLFDLPLHDEEDSQEGISELEEDQETPLADAGDLSMAPVEDQNLAEMSLFGETETDEAEDEGEDEAKDEDEDEAEDEGSDEPSAPVHDRLLSGLLDLGIQLLVVGVAVASTHFMGLTLELADWMPFAILGVIFSFLYWFIPLAFWGQTPGMAWVGNSAVGRSNVPLTFGQSVLRWVGALFTLVLGGLPVLLALREHSLTDRLSDSKTIVL